MKKKNLIVVSIATLLCLSAGGVLAFKRNEAKQANAYSTSDLPTTIDLNDCSPTEIRNYYSGLSGLAVGQRQGTNLLKNLKPILKNGQKYYSYDTENSGRKIWQIYEISDRDWKKSPASSTTYGTYNQSTNKITNYVYGTGYGSAKNNPYIHALYVNRDVDNQMRAWTLDGTENNHGGNKEWYIDREHIWPKSQGFEETGAGGARGDVMHLWAGDSYVNSGIHNNQLYGYVGTIKTDGADKYSYTKYNYLGSSLTLKSGQNVFEPQDSDKGDIARAIFYLVARYNYLSGSDSDGIDSNNPNLTLVQSNESLSSYTSTTTNPGKMGILTDLLAWHHADPVDEYEVHRNNLLYKNFTNNRNPFIDFPEWVDYIWGTATYNGRNYQSYDNTPTGAADPSNDTINGYNEGGTPITYGVTGVTVTPTSVSILKNNTYQLSAEVLPSYATNKNVSWSSSNTSIATVSNTGLVTAKAAGNVNITVTTEDGGYTATCAVSIPSGSTIPVTGISLDPKAVTMREGETAVIRPTLSPNGATNQNVTWTSSKTTVATVSNGTVTAVSAGTATITATSVDGGYTDTCSILVKSSGTGEPITATTNIRTYAEAHNWTNGTKYESMEMDSVITASIGGTGNTGKYYNTSGYEWRFYQNGGGAITISTGTDLYDLDSITFTYAINNNGVLLDSNDNTMTSGTAISVTGNTATFRVGSTSGTTGQIKFTDISVTYHATTVIETTDITASTTKSFHVGDTITKSDISVVDNNSLKITDFIFSQDGYRFTYEDANGGGALTEKEFTIEYEELETTLVVNVSRQAYAKQVDDVIDSSVTEITSTSYTEFSDKTLKSSSTYAGLCAGTGGTVQLRTTNSNSGVVTTNSSNNVKKVSVEWNEQTTSSILEIYGKTTAYSAASDLFNESNRGTLLGSITYGETTELEVIGNYTYVGVRVKTGSNAAYLSKLIISYDMDNENTLTNYVMFEDTENQCTSKFSVATGIFTGMSASARALFMTSDDFTVATARERLLAWAEYLGKTITFSGGDYIITDNTNSLFTGNVSNQIVYLIVIISSLNVVAVAALVIFRKKKSKRLG